MGCLYPTLMSRLGATAKESEAINPSIFLYPVNPNQTHCTLIINFWTTASAAYVYICRVEM